VLSRQNLSNWIIKGASLLGPILETLKQELLASPLLHSDETTLEALCKPGRRRRNPICGYTEHPVLPRNLLFYMTTRRGATGETLCDWPQKLALL